MKGLDEKKLFWFLKLGSPKVVQSLYGAQRKTNIYWSCLLSNKSIEGKQNFCSTIIGFTGGFDS